MIRHTAPLLLGSLIAIGLFPAAAGTGLAQRPGAPPPPPPAPRPHGPVGQGQGGPASSPPRRPTDESGPASRSFDLAPLPKGVRRVAVV
ncbi:MAG TPA: hypothetical protein VKT77_00165, partial [Chthonomonadaceae bacterium]|nr:hypothetical protein [Chthonomonadaceae bacterium]